MDDWTAEIYVHAMAIEQEAARRYAELSRRMAQARNHEAAALFAEFSNEEARHLEALCARSRGAAMPQLSSDYTWCEIDIGTAVQAEKRARAFFEQARRVAPHPAVAALADEMTAEENDHLTRIERLDGAP
jgi:rubrerythrin